MDSPYIREFKIPRRRQRQKCRLKSDFSIYETLAQLSQLGHYVLCRRTLLELNSEEKYPGLQRVKEIRCRMFTLLINVKLGNSRRSRAVTAKKCTKKRDALAKLLFG